MELVPLIIAFILRLGAGSAVLAFLLPHVVPSSGFDWIILHRWTVSLASVVVLGLVDQVFIYPFFRSPYRVLPRVKEDYFGQVIFESPRGSTPLRWMKRYPEAELIVSLGPFNLPDLICCGPESLRDILSTNTYDFEKSGGVRAFLSRVLGYGLILSEGEEHKRQRKLLTPAFNIKRIRELYGLMWSKTQVLQRELDKDITKNADDTKKGWGVVEISEWASRLTLDIIGPTAMGRDFKSMENEDNSIAKAFIELLEPRLDGLIFLGAHWVLPEWILRRVPVRVNRDIERICGFLRGTCIDIVKEKKAEVAKDKSAINEYDILSGIIQTEAFPDDLLVDEMLTFLAAGHETTANALTWVCYLCAKYPHIQRNLRTEIRSKIPSSTASVDFELLESMPYLNGVCEETLRLYPTVSTTIREAKRDTTLNGITVKAGTEVLIVPYAINRHPRFWGDDADMIIPERWIDTLEDGIQRPNKNGGASTNFAEITFLHGPRSCIGRDFAKAELRCAVAGILGKFEFELHDTAEPKLTGLITTKPEGGMRLKLRALDGW